MNRRAVIETIAASGTAAAGAVVATDVVIAEIGEIAGRAANAATAMNVRIVANAPSARNAASARIGPSVPNAAVNAGNVVVPAIATVIAHGRGLTGPVPGRASRSVHRWRLPRLAPKSRMWLRWPQ